MRSKTYIAAWQVIDSYRNQYGSLYFKANVRSNDVHLEERVYAAVEVEWNTLVTGITVSEAIDLLLEFPKRVAVWDDSDSNPIKKEAEKMAWDSPLKYEERVIVEWMQMPEKTKQKLIRVLLEKGVVKIGSKLDLYVDENHPALSGQEKAE